MYHPSKSASNQARGNGQKMLSFFVLLLLAIVTEGGHKHLSAFYMTSRPVLNSSQGGDGARAKWSYTAVRGCQHFNNRKLLCRSRTLTGMQIFPLAVSLSLDSFSLSFLQCHHPHTFIRLSFFAPPTLQLFQINPINVKRYGVMPIFFWLLSSYPHVFTSLSVSSKLALP